MYEVYSEPFAIFEFRWQTSPFDDDDDDFRFEEGNAELASELREYADDDDEYERASVTILPPLPRPFDGRQPPPIETAVERRLAATPRKPHLPRPPVTSTAVPTVAAKVPAKKAETTQAPAVKTVGEKAVANRHLRSPLNF